MGRDKITGGGLLNWGDTHRKMLFAEIRVASECTFDSQLSLVSKQRTEEAYFCQSLMYLREDKKKRISVNASNLLANEGLLP